MRLGLASPLKHETPKEWAANMKAIGCGCVVFPVDYMAGEAVVSAYAEAAEQEGLTIAEVGAWSNPLSPDEDVRSEAFTRCVRQLQLADRIGASCCVNIAGSAGSRWDGAYKENFTEAHWKKTARSIQNIIDEAMPERTYYTLEPMPWMVPAGPEQYLRLLEDVNRERFAVHMDLANWITSPDKYFNNHEFMEQCFAMLGDRIKSCHIKDVSLREEFTFQLKETACGDGTLDLRNYIRLAEHVNPDMPVIIEHLKGDEEYLESLKYVKRFGPDIP